MVLFLIHVFLFNEKLWLKKTYWGPSTLNMKSKGWRLLFFCLYVVLCYLNFRKDNVVKVRYSTSSYFAKWYSINPLVYIRFLFAISDPFTRLKIYFILRSSGVGYLKMKQLTCFSTLMLICDLTSNAVSAIGSTMQVHFYSSLQTQSLLQQYIQNYGLAHTV